jgi:type I restriction enzyme S subunit
MVVVNPKQVPFISGLHTIVAKPKTDELVDLFKRYCFQTVEVKEQFRFYAVGTKVSGVSKTNIRKISILVPQPEEQTAIDTILSDMDTEITALEARLTKARHLKQGMAQALLTGRIRLV